MKSVSGLLILVCSSAISGGIDDERLLESLIKQGVICEGQSEIEKQESLQIYLSQKFSKTSKQSHKEDPSDKKSTDCISAKE
ncbi:hypothetical protein OPW33_09820 [Vibrio europaeus]|uniref:hypothetical protein n=1 Tax=Vibrio europaeus TaxID=300876 RepID=UPI00233EA48D|nr:hypothetical protein [Vibrio europaeus]MDC5819581.1 hypothetical protein [Vibrio europaeus]MDC5839631.1 hypothetical protein [Vibrio europaeus]MDC5871831.1 hypothetical protein [Vibrio europaeus]